MTKRRKYRSRSSKALAARRFILGFFFAISFVSFGFFEPWNEINDPKKRWGDDLELNSDRLLDRAGENVILATSPWTNTFYPKRRGGFARRYDDTEDRKQGPSSLRYATYTNDELLGLGKRDLLELSAAEKLDIINGRAFSKRSDEYSYENDRSYYPFLKSTRHDVKDDVESPSEHQWMGSCHALSAASINHPEPDYTDYTVGVNTRAGNRDLELPLTSSDIKGFLMMAYDEQITKEAYPMIDAKCRDENDEKYRKSNCVNMNAGSFHVVLLNQIGIRQSAFIADFDAGVPVWNHPVDGYKIVWHDWYKSEDGRYLISKKAHPNTWREIEFETNVYYIDAGNIHKFAKGQDKTRDNYRKFQKVQYRIEVDRDMNILGGTWISDEHPDYFWNFPKIEHFEGDYEFLNDLLK